MALARKWVGVAGKRLRSAHGYPLGGLPKSPYVSLSAFMNPSVYVYTYIYVSLGVHRGSLGALCILLVYIGARRGHRDLFLYRHGHTRVYIYALCRCALYRGMHKGYYRGPYMCLYGGICVSICAYIGASNRAFCIRINNNPLRTYYL